MYQYYTVLQAVLTFFQEENVKKLCDFEWLSQLKKHANQNGI